VDHLVNSRVGNGIARFEDIAFFGHFAHLVTFSS
jgi:hypothetical protein